MPAATRFNLEKAKQNKLFYVVANVVIYRQSDQRCLVLKRSETEKVHPGKYAVPGGKLEWSDLDLNHPTRLNGDVLDFEDAIEKLLHREVSEESGISVKGPWHFINDVAYLRPDGVPTILFKLAALYDSGDVILESDAFTDHAWVNAQEVEKLPCIDGIAIEVARTIQLFSNNN